MTITDRFVKHAKKTVAEGNYFLVVGFLFVAPSLMSIYISGYRGIAAMSIPGILLGVYGLLLTVVANDRRSRSAKITAIIAIPLMFALISLLYTSK